MGWISVGNRALRIGKDAAGLAALVDVVSGLVRDSGEGYERLLEDLANGEFPQDATLPDDLRGSVQALAEAFLGAEAADRIGMLLARLGEVADQGDAPSQVFWPHGTWRTDLPQTSFRLALELEGGVAFTVRPGPPDSGSGGAREVGVPVRLAFNGRGEAAADARMPLTDRLGVSASAEGRLERDLGYDLRYERDAVTGHVLYDALWRVVRVDDLGEIRRAFSAASPAVTTTTGAVDRNLRRITLRGNEGLELRGNLAITTPLASGGTFSGSLGGRFSVGRSYELAIVPDSDGAVRVDGTFDRGSERAGELTIGYRLGVGDLPPATIRQALQDVAGVDSVLEDLKSDTDTVYKWLQPGTALQSSLRRAIQKRIESDSGDEARALKLAFADLVGVDADGPVNDVAEEAAAEIREWIDDAADFFGGGTGAALKELLAGVVPKAEKAVRDELGEIADELSGEIEKELKALAEGIDSDVHGALKELLDGSPRKKIDSLRQFLDQARSLLAQLAKGLQDDTLDALSAEIAMSRSSRRSLAGDFAFSFSPAARGHYRKLIWRPGRNAMRIFDSRPAGVRVISDESGIREQSAVERLQKWNLGMLDILSFGSETRKLASIEIVHNGNGLTVGSKSQIRRTRGALLGEDRVREIRFLDSLAFELERSTDAASSSGALSPTGSLALVLVQREHAWQEESEDAERFARVFRDAGLVREQDATDFVRLVDRIRERGGSDPRGEARATLRLTPVASSELIAFARTDRQRTEEIAEAAMYEAGVEGPAEMVASRVHRLIDAFRQLAKARERVVSVAQASTLDKRSAIRREVLEAQQEAMDRVADFWTKPDWPEFAEPYEGVLAFFLVLQRMAAEATESTPGIVLSFREDGRPNARRVPASPVDGPALVVRPDTRYPWEGGIQAP